MICDRTQHASDYFGIHPRFEAAFDFLARHGGDLSTRDAGRVDIDGDHLFAVVNHYDSKPIQEGKFEAHRKYIDIQILLTGVERIGYANIDDLNAETAYDEEDDYTLYTGEGSFIAMAPDRFVIFHPQDGHMPNIAIDQPVAVRKVVFKVQSSH